VATGTAKGTGRRSTCSIRACRIRYIITVEALKEGWDCSFAYVLCSLQESRSAKDVEQLLGRVLRMPYARARATPELNRAYAHVIADEFFRSGQPVDRPLWFNNMGFEKYEAAGAVTPGSASLFPDEAATPKPGPLLPDCVLSVPYRPSVARARRVASGHRNPPYPAAARR
jgi:type III restriction enzyme